MNLYKTHVIIFAINFAFNFFPSSVALHHFMGEKWKLISISERFIFFMLFSLELPNLRDFICYEYLYYSAP